MFYPKKLIVPVFVCAVLAGVGLHFLYACTLSALLSPVCESLWEHIKILYWPYLAASAFLAWGRPTGMRPWLLSLVILCPLMLVLGLLLHAALALHALWLDIALYLGLSASVMGYLLGVTVASRRGGSVAADEIGLPVSRTGLTLPCGSTAIWTRD